LIITDIDVLPIKACRRAHTTTTTTTITQLQQPFPFSVKYSNLDLSQTILGIINHLHISSRGALLLP
jgi:hypothetical protein